MSSLAVYAVGASGPLGVTQHELLDLPRGCLRQLERDVNVAGYLVAGDLGAHVRDQLVRGCARADTEQDERLRALAPPVVGYPDDRGVEYGRVAHQRLLHLDGGDVLAAGAASVANPE